MRPQLIELRVVRCPLREQDEKALDLVAGQFVAVDLGVDERMGERVAVAPVGLARNVIDESGQGGTGAKERFERILSSGTNSGSPWLRMMFVISDELVYSRGCPSCRR